MGYARISSKNKSINQKAYRLNRWFPMPKDLWAPSNYIVG